MQSIFRSPGDSDHLSADANSCHAAALKIWIAPLLDRHEGQGFLLMVNSPVHSHLISFGHLRCQRAPDWKRIRGAYGGPRKRIHEIRDSLLVTGRHVHLRLAIANRMGHASDNRKKKDRAAK